MSSQEPSIEGAEAEVGIRLTEAVIALVESGRRAVAVELAARRFAEQVPHPEWDLHAREQNREQMRFLESAALKFGINPDLIEPSRVRAYLTEKPAHGWAHVRLTDAVWVEDFPPTNDHPYRGRWVVAV